MSREGIYGGEQNIWAAIGGQHYCALPFTRLISGHADFTGGYFGHGPKLRGSSWTLQMAANIIYTSSMLHWVSNPADMEAAFPKDSPEREVVRNIPSVWEETIVLPPSAIGECAAFARRSGNQVVHCSDERRRQGTHRFHSFEFPGQKHGIPGHHSPGSGGKK